MIFKNAVTNMTLWRNIFYHIRAEGKYRFKLKLSE